MEDGLLALSDSGVRIEIACRLGLAELVYFPVIDSTHTYLESRSVADLQDGLLAVADYQTAGRGQQSRKWQAEPGASLLFSSSFRVPTCPPQILEIRVGLAVARGVSRFTTRAVMLKVPNDLVVDDRKVGGILCSTIGPVCVVGVGINCWGSVVEDASFQLPFGRLAEKPGAIDRLTMLIGIIEAIRGASPGWHGNLSCSELCEFKSRNWLGGRRMRCVETGEIATVRALTACGKLKLETSQGDIDLFASEIELSD
ncbi:MAG: biotin--acetyl-CoA-carboxylase ligase [Candidatus Berkelbacteria bacterium]|nr:biotin--acetyl-CoA-carboxylase ligase [Candidatus Berkelbacteria bacterium]